MYIYNAAYRIDYFFNFKLITKYLKKINCPNKFQAGIFWLCISLRIKYPKPIRLPNF